MSYDLIRNAIDRFAAPDGVAMDVGANMGVITRFMAERFGTVVAFEANPDLAAALASTMPANVTVVPMLVGDRFGSRAFHIDTREGVGAVASSVHRLVGMEEQTRTIDVEAITLDAHCARTGECPTLIKIDAEGAEPEIIRGARDIIMAHRPVLIFEFWETWYNAGFKDVFSYLSRVGYGMSVLETGEDVQTAYVARDGALNREGRTADILAVHSGKPG